MAPMINKPRMSFWPCFDAGPSRSLLPVECCFDIYAHLDDGALQAAAEEAAGLIAKAMGFTEDR